VDKYQRYPNAKCLVCSKPIYKRPIEIERNKGRVFCGQACFGISCRKETPCIVCGKPKLANRHKKTCSHACANKNRAKIIEKAKGFHKDNVKNARALKLRLIKIRGNCCERCGYNKVEILQVHHKDENRKNNHLDNLELICPNCHFEQHYLEKSWMKHFDWEGSPSGLWRKS
jgi:hypothetical protein